MGGGEPGGHGLETDPVPVAAPEPVDTLDTGQAPRRDRIEITVLGTPAIIDADPQRKPRAKALELLVYLAVCDGDASTEAILDDLLPDAPARKAVHRLHTYVSDLRAVLRHNAGPGTYLTRHHHRYQLNPTASTSTCGACAPRSAPPTPPGHDPNA